MEEEEFVRDMSARLHDANQTLRKLDAEVERLRLTGVEREAVKETAAYLAQLEGFGEQVKTLRGLLERTK